MGRPASTLKYEKKSAKIHLTTFYGFRSLQRSESLERFLSMINGWSLDDPEWNQPRLKGGQPHLTAINHSTAVTKAAKTTPKGTIGWSLSHVPTLFRKKLHFKGRVLKIKLSKMYHQSTWNVFFFGFQLFHQKLELFSYDEKLGPADGPLRST